MMVDTGSLSIRSTPTLSETRLAAFRSLAAPRSSVVVPHVDETIRVVDLYLAARRCSHRVRRCCHQICLREPSGSIDVSASPPDRRLTTSVGGLHRGLGRPG